ncbi:MAG: ABC-F family ATP-binding cassette domain-containing protein [Muribaculaceae bacterium]|nr:ABC-F family ATP-binding cassette domain-containing protein [Muribaculaceae bacterium]
MISYLQLENLTKSHGDRMIFADVTFGINQGDKIALIAKNGTGKTTLLRCIAGSEGADSGKITPRKDLKIGFLEQTPDLPGEMTVEQFAGGNDRLKRLLTQMEVYDSGALISTLSGGQRKRLALAQVIASEPDLLILDEPTNHLDIPTIEWLENYLSRSKVTLLMVTHDRYFLDRVCDKIIEIDRAQVYIHEGNYANYLRRRRERLEGMASELVKVKNTLRKEQDWMNRQPQARAGKAQYRIDAFHDLKKRSQVNLNERNVDLRVNSSYIGSKIFEAEGVSKSFGDKKVLDNFSYIFSRYEKVGIIGRNGAGKSTFIKMLQGLVQPDSGHFDIGETVRFGYYSQDGIAFDENKRVIDAITEMAEDIVVNDGTHYSPMQFLQHFLFTPADQQKYISKLSGGERSRLHLAAVLMRSPNFLILDEPTNDLDIMTLGILEDYLADFKGCVIVISHDRFFLDSIADHLFVFEGDGKVKDFPGNYTEYRAWRDARDREEKLATEKSTQAATQRSATADDTPPAKVSRGGLERARKLTFKERKEFEELTKEIETLTKEKQELETLFNSGESIADIDEKSRRYTALTDLLDEKEMRWLELSEMA